MDYGKNSLLHPILLPFQGLDLLCRGLKGTAGLSELISIFAPQFNGYKWHILPHPLKIMLKLSGLPGSDHRIKKKEGTHMEYQFRDIEKKWQAKWKADNAYQVNNDFSKPKFYVLDMFPYPSGAGLHVGHPLGYIASDIYSRYKRLKGFNVLHPMGFDSFRTAGRTICTRYRSAPRPSLPRRILRRLKNSSIISVSVSTGSGKCKPVIPSYYKWTQWIFLQLFGSFSTGKRPKRNLLTAW